METLNTVNDVQAPVVEAQRETLSSEETDLAPRPQSQEENASFRRMRLENQRLKAENEQLSADALERRMAQDLSDIRAMDPDVTSLESLGEEFAAMISLGVSAPVAFAAIRQAESMKNPPVVGAMEGTQTREKDFYLPDEVDALSPADLKDPSIWERVRASMTKW